MRSASLLGVAAAAAALTAAPAHATSIIGFGNGAVDNACTNRATGATANAATMQGSGTAGGLRLAMPSLAPINQCGNLGLPQENYVARNVISTRDQIQQDDASAALPRYR
ncbi:hypothetical protein [Streptomyces sp. CA-256286]|uniref:hypothetical protein n=1 Tax=Streptomyces sp. CA-256286 TaxID=2801033 RepID=UPI001A97EFDD|nr:hypothetical protein [Streptomyces sp. CA-256286]